MQDIAPMHYIFCCSVTWERSFIPGIFEVWCFDQAIKGNVNHSSSRQKCAYLCHLRLGSGFATPTAQAKLLLRRTKSYFKSSCECKKIVSAFLTFCMRTHFVQKFHVHSLFFDVTFLSEKRIYCDFRLALELKLCMVIFIFNSNRKLDFTQNVTYDLFGIHITMLHKC